MDGLTNAYPTRPVVICGTGHAFDEEWQVHALCVIIFAQEHITYQDICFENIDVSVTKADMSPFS